MGVWIETFGIAQKYQKARSHPVWVCGLKHLVNNINVTIKRSHPVWVCGLKHGEELMKEIAIGHTLYWCVDWNILTIGDIPFNHVTPCMGVWIETRPQSAPFLCCCVTPCMGVWIETRQRNPLPYLAQSHPVWVCGLKLRQETSNTRTSMSHPVWVCGLKRLYPDRLPTSYVSHPVWVCGLKQKG